jgi:hypothetical protein
LASAALAPTEIRDGLWKRYREAYSVAGSIVSFGKLVQQIAAGLAALILLVSLITGIIGDNWFLCGIGVVSAIIVGGGGWISGIIIMAQGQIVQSVIDTAVNTSPLLDNPSKAQFLGVDTNKEPELGIWTGLKKEVITPSD